VLPNPYEFYIGLEAGAASIRNFEPIVVPGLLQTADYARETFRNGPIELDPDEVERLIEVRQARQEVLARDDRPRLWAVIDEAVIHRVVGGVGVMRGQLRHLAESAQQGKTTVQVMPYRAGAHTGAIGAFVILDFPEATDPAVVYVETLAGDIYLEERSDVNRYTLAFDRLRAASGSTCPAPSGARAATAAKAATAWKWLATCPGWWRCATPKSPTGRNW
jgi:hypothetical protein